MKMIKSSNIRSFANKLTLFRAFISIPLIAALCFEKLPIAWLILVIGGLTDIFDGWLARKADGGNPWGARLDPLADKILLSAPLIWLASKGVLPVWSIWLLLSRELLISGWRSSDKKGSPASKTGKLKTILQFVCILLLIWPTEWGSTQIVISIQQIGWLLFWPSLIIAMLSAVKYLKSQIKFDQY